MNRINNKSIFKIKWLLLLLDVIAYLIVCVPVTFLSASGIKPIIIAHYAIVLVLLVIFRFIFRIYKVVWRYGGVGSYLRLIFCDVSAFLVFLVLEFSIPEFFAEGLGWLRGFALFTIDGMVILFARLCYRYVYMHMNEDNLVGKFSRTFLRIFGSLKHDMDDKIIRKINIAVVGAGRTGSALAEELHGNNTSGYSIKIFIDIDKEKIGREILDIPVYDEVVVDSNTLIRNDIEEVVFALPNVTSDVKANLFNKYKKMGYKIRSYDYPTLGSANSQKKTLRDFDIDELLFRNQIDLVNKNVYEYYKGKVIMITGGGGSIGSEIARQLAKMSPKLILIVDIYENNAYDLQQELKLIYGNDFNIKVDILSVTNKVYLEKLFKRYHVDIVIHAAAHKHVPLMERNCLEAVNNNVFGTLSVVDLAYKYKCERFIMVSTDKAVNPTNVMGATKRMCEMIVQAYSTKKNSHTKFSFTRFGNVLGSAGSVIPLFKKQISNGGPVTITDKRIIRYFMTIPEASSLVLESGYMAKNGELFVLDMGKPIKILELAENIISLSGYRPYIDIDIVEIGLRPGEKLYEELLIKTENLTKTDNKLIFIEKDVPISMDEMNEKLDLLRKAIDSNVNANCREAMKICVPTYKDPDEVNIFALDSDEMQESE